MIAQVTLTHAIYLPLYAGPCGKIPNPFDPFTIGHPALGGTIETNLAC
jgi:hypothetical protein